jgi:hypothetical protein
MGQRVAYAIGFTQGEETELGEFLGGKAWTLQRADEWKESGAEAVVLCFVCVRDEEGLSRLKGALTDHPEAKVVACAPLEDRSLCFKAAASGPAAMAFLPLDRNEVERAAARCHRLAEEERCLFLARPGGRAMIGYELTWATRSFPVTPLARYSARFLRAWGFASGQSEEDAIALSLEEAMVNSLEHGNLELDSSLRPASPLDEDLYEERREQRMRDEAYGGRPLTLRIQTEGETARLTLIDSGPGFDWRKAGYDESKAADVSGKGFALIRRAFDGARYEEDGTVLVLEKRRAARPGGVNGV